jgi:hypothetical protein
MGTYEGIPFPGGLLCGVAARYWLNQCTNQQITCNIYSFFSHLNFVKSDPHLGYFRGYVFLSAGCPGEVGFDKSAESYVRGCHTPIIALKRKATDSVFSSLQCLAHRIPVFGLCCETPSGSVAERVARKTSWACPTVVRAGRGWISNTVTSGGNIIGVDSQGKYDPIRQ